MKTKFSRRKFLKSTIATGAVVAGAPLIDINASSLKNPYDPKGLPTAVLGKTGVTIPRLAFGLGSRFCAISTADEAHEVLNHALNNGLYYWDTAHAYEDAKTKVLSEERLGPVVNKRRKEIFLSTKLMERDPEKIKQQFELSLKRLQTDHVDILKIHSIESLDDVANITRKGGVLDVISKFRDQKMTRFIGFSGHGSAAALKAMVDTGRFDTMLFAMNHWAGYKEDRQGLVIPAALEKGMGVMLMKAVRPKETIKGIEAKDLVRFALSLKGPSGIVVGMDSIKVVDSNLAVLHNFEPMDEQEKLKFAMLLAPFFRHENLPWMKEGYHDGYWS